jgi:site-specific DNA-methyltransferase (adenine-specific)
MEITGQTYSTAHYEEFNKTKNKAIFEDVIDRMILEGVSGMNESFRNAISSLPKKEKRLTILSLLDKDLNLFKRIKALISDERLTKMDHLEQVILMLREYVKVGEVEKKKFGEVMTDLKLVKHILSKIPKEDFKNPNKTFIDISNGTGVFPLVVIYRLMKGLADVEGFEDPEFRYKHIVENQIYTAEIQPKNVFLYLCLVDPYDEYDLNIYCGSSLDKGLRTHMSDVWNKTYFDYSIGNPPFNQMIDMKFVSLSYEIADVICFVHPSTWLLDEKGKQKKFNDTKNLVKDHLDSIELFNGNKIFNIALFVPCVITYVDKYKKDKGIKCVDKINNVELVYDDIYQINKYSNRDEYISINNKIKNFSSIDNLLNYKNIDNGEYYVNTAQIRGNVLKNSDHKMIQDDFYTIVTKDTTVSRTKEKHMFFSFNTETEAENFLRYIKTDFCRFCLSILKNNSQLDRGELSIIPWLDFSKNWTDEILCNEFNLNNKEVDFIKSVIPKYY